MPPHDKAPGAFFRLVLSHMLTPDTRVITNGRQFTGSRGTCHWGQRLPARRVAGAHCVSASGGRLPGARARVQLAPGGRVDGISMPQEDDSLTTVARGGVVDAVAYTARGNKGGDVIWHGSISHVMVDNTAWSDEDIANEHATV